MSKLPVLNVDDDDDGESGSTTDVTKVKGEVKESDGSPVTVVVRGKTKQVAAPLPGLRALRPKT
jgi:hypothetical protein